MPQTSQSLVGIETAHLHGLWRQFTDRFEDNSPTLYEDNSPTRLFKDNRPVTGDYNW